ncbi:MAG TPA: PQQ-binding-like beta-propeller repeat protein [Gemmataceae bacterium]|nr:PQQ-binding-like beta-propeller repeat protein [Gemmataceae bacterium]
MKSRMIVVFLLTIGLLATEDGLAQQRPAEKKQPTASPAKSDKKATTDVRDSLPDGALARLGTIRQRVPAWAKLAIRPDGRTFVTVVAGCLIGEWDVASGTLRRQWQLPGSPSESCWLASNGRLLAVKEKGKLAIWDLIEGTRRHIFPVEPSDAAFSSDGKMLATNGQKQSWIDLWNIADGKKRRLTGLPSHVRTLTFSPNGKRLFAAVDGSSLRCWDVTSGRQLWQNKHSAWQLVVADDGRLLCSGAGGEGEMHVWEAETGRQIKKIVLEKETLSYTDPVAFLSGGRSVLLNSREGLMTWDLKNGILRRRMPDVGRFVLAPGGKTAITLTNSLLQRWDMESYRPLYADTQSMGHGSAVVALAFSPDGRTLASSSINDTIRLWDLATRRPRPFPGRTRNGLNRYVTYVRWESGLLSWRVAPPLLVFTPNNQKLLVEGAEGKLSMRRVDTGEETLRLDVRRDGEERISTARISPDGRTIWTWCGYELNKQNTLSSWDVRSGRCLSSRPIIRSDDEKAHLFSPDGRYAVLDDGPVMDLAAGQALLGRASNPEKFRSFAFSPDSRLMAAVRLPDGGSLVHEVRVYEMLTGRLLARLSAAVNRASCNAFSPDGRLLIAAGADALHVWEVATGRRLLHLPAEGRLPYGYPSHFATCLAIAPDGRSAATGQDDGTVLLWDLTPAWRRLSASGEKLTSARRLACWTDLLAEDPKTAYGAMTDLTGDAAATVAFLGEHLPLPPLDTRKVERWLSDLDGDDFAKRESASRELKALAGRIEPRLRQALKETKSLEARRRLREILESATESALAPETVRHLRGIVVLEQIATAEARRVLQELGQGDSGTRLTAAAQDALRRLTSRK